MKKRATGQKEHLRRTAEQQAAAAYQAPLNFTLQEIALLGLSGDRQQERPYVNLKYYLPSHECLSEWTAAELKALGAFCRRLGQLTWSDIYASGGKIGVKSGLGYTKHKNLDVLPPHPDLQRLSPDLTWFELRVDRQARVHGFRVKDAFFLVFLDRAHNIYPQS